MTRRKKTIVLVAVLLPLIVIGAALLYLNFADLSGWRDTVERLASDAIGRELRINGEFHPEIGLTTRVVASDVTLASADWSAEPHMVAVDRLDAGIDLISIIRGPITIRDVKITGARVLFETSDDGLFNWDLGSDEPAEPSDGDVELAITTVQLADAELVYVSPDDPPIEARIARLGFADDGTGMLDLEVDGTIRQAPFEISGRLGTLMGLITSDTVTHDLRGRFGNSEFSLQGSIADLGSLSGVDSRIAVRGPDLHQPLDLLELETGLDGPFELSASAQPDARGSKIELEVSAGDLSGAVEGTVDSLTGPRSLDVVVDLRGPDVSTVASLAGIDDVPPQPFSVTGRLAWEGFPISFDDVDIRVGSNRLAVHGVLGGLPEMLGTDLRFEGEGPDIAVLTALAGLRLPRDEYSVRGRLIREELGLRAEEINARLGQSTLSANGFIGDPPSYSATSLEIRTRLERPNRYSHLVGRSLPEETLEISGRFSEGDGSIELEGVTARFGGHEVQLDGNIVTDQGLVGTDLEVQATGPDLSRAAVLAGLDGAPAVEYEIVGGLRVVSGGFGLDNVKATAGPVQARATGIVTTRPGLLGTALEVSGRGPDLAHLEWLTGLDSVPAGDFEISGGVRVNELGYELAGAAARVGDMTAAIDGVITTAPGLAGTELTVDIEGLELSGLEPLLDQPGLPPAPFSLAGDLRIDSDGFVLDGVQVGVDGSNITLTGALSAAAGLAGTDLEITAEVPDLGHLGGLAAELVELPVLPSERLAVSTRLAIDENGYSLEGLDGTLGRAEFTIDGRIGQPPRFVGTDLTIDADGPDASLIKAVTGLQIPVAPFQVNGRIERLENSIRFHRVSTRIGEHRVAVNGSLGELPKLIGTDLEIHGSGPDTNLYEAIAGLPELPDRAFTLDGRFSGTPERFSARDFKLTFGHSDIQGSFTVNMTDRPAIEARLDSRVLDLSHLGGPVEAAEDTTRSSPPGADDADTGKGALLFRDEAMDLGWLQAADANVEIRVSELLLRAVRFRDLAVDIDLENGRLEIPRMAAAGRGEGRMTGSLLLERRQEGYGLETDISLRHVRLDPPDAITELLERPPIDIDIDLEAVGATPHELASSTNGAVQLVIGQGIFDSSVVDLVTADILLTLVNALNPFAKEDPTTELQCGVALLSITDGIAKLEPMAFQSDKMTLLGEGKVDLETEKLNFRWVTKPRKGIGISASVITNPYIKLGGTLADPSLELKPLEAVTSTGVAVATLGISWLAKGMFDRITAEKKVCKQALKEIEARGRETTADHRDFKTD